MNLHSDIQVFNMPDVHAMLNSGKQGFIHIFFFH